MELTSKTGKRMMERISPIYDESYIMAALMQAVGAEHDYIKMRYDELILQMLPETATWGMKYWEQRYHIPIDENKPIEERRQAVIIKRNLRAPMNPTRIERLAADAIGTNVAVAEEITPQTIGIIFNRWGIPQKQITAMDELLRKVSPAHLQILYKMMICSVQGDTFMASGCSCAPKTTIDAWMMINGELCTEAVAVGSAGNIRTIIFAKEELDQ